MTQKRHRSDSSASSWTIFTAASIPDPDSDALPQDTKHPRPTPAAPTAAAISCFLPPSCAGTGFASLELFETHYVHTHTNRCLECGRNFPTARFLELHIAEWHDPLSELRRERGEKGYGCFVDDCERFCSTPQKRRRHVIDKHHFPKEYNWGIVQWGIDNHTTLLTRAPSRGDPAAATTPVKPKKLGGKNPSPKTKDVGGRKRTVEVREEGEGMDVEAGTREKEVVQEAAVKREVKEVEMADVVGAMGGLKLVPVSIRFGRRGSGR